MKPTKLDQRFLESTRGKIVNLLRGSSCTVEELAARLGLTDNAVRAHLTTLERDGLIRQSGVRRGPRKPHFTYTLTPEAEKLFPKAYDALLNQLIAVLKLRLPEEEIEGVLREVGRGLAEGVPAAVGDDLQARVQHALRVLESIGGAAEARQEGDKIIISAGGCPLAAAVSAHPEVCRLAESLIAEITGTTVKERCDREGVPHCRFEIDS
ncbi:MAG: ArsR family transcriptional regulator [Acidobacteria bacterium]|nr:ArsR family transcriptional regulator [Acidobacteriota bacterium]